MLCRLKVFKLTKKYWLKNFRNEDNLVFITPFARKCLTIYSKAMIKGFEEVHLLPAQQHGHIQWTAGFGAGFIAGAILLIVPRGSPWSALTFFSPVIMGRSLPPGLELPLAMVWLIHLGVSMIYGLIISRGVASLTRARAVLIGGTIGLLLYGLNWLAVGLFSPGMRGNEVSVVFTHIVFGLIAAGAYRGLLRRKMGA